MGSDKLEAGSRKQEKGRRMEEESVEVGRKAWRQAKAGVAGSRKFGGARSVIDKKAEPPPPPEPPCLRLHTYLTYILPPAASPLSTVTTANFSGALSKVSGTLDFIHHEHCKTCKAIVL